MSPEVGLSAEILERLRCPACRSPLEGREDSFACRAPECAREYPVVGGVPVLIDEDTSLFALADYARNPERVAVTPPRRARNPLFRLKNAAYRLLPDVTSNLSAETGYRRLAELLPATSPRPRVLIVGGREVGRGMRDFIEGDRFEFVETDIDFGPRTGLVCDAHQLPFADGSFDAVVAQAVLEHVLDPHRCVEEIHRVLGPGGLVYAETPFMQRRHGGRFDFTRFTFLGHRRLFRRFEEVASGVAVGPGVGLAWQYNGFLLAFSDRRPVRAVLRIVGRLTSFWLKYLDGLLAKREGSLDAASGFFFLGRRSEKVLTDRELIRQFRGVE